MNGSECHSRRHLSIFKFILVSQPFFIAPGKPLVTALRPQGLLSLSPPERPSEPGITWTCHSQTFIFFPIETYLTSTNSSPPETETILCPSNRQNLILQDTSTENTMFMVPAETTGQCQCFTLCAPETSKGCCLWAKQVSAPTM